MGKKNEAARMLANLNGPWSNAACMGYCLIAMRRANLRPRAPPPAAFFRGTGTIERRILS